MLTKFCNLAKSILQRGRHDEQLKKQKLALRLPCGASFCFWFSVFYFMRGLEYAHIGLSPYLRSFLRLVVLATFLAGVSTAAGTAAFATWQLRIFAEVPPFSPNE